MTAVLIVDDAAFARRMIRKFLQVDGYEILEAANGREGLEIARSQPLDCVVTDILMPDMDGFEFMKTLQSEGFKIPVIIVTADIQEPTKNRAIELGAAGFINKPPKQEEVRQAVQQIFSLKD